MRTSHRIHRTHSESGIALPHRHVVLMLISAVAISLVISSGTESSIGRQTIGQP